MAKQSSTFSSILENLTSKRRVLRVARMGTRRLPVSPDYGDAFYAVAAVQRYRELVPLARADIEGVDAVIQAWEDRKSWP